MKHGIWTVALLACAFDASAHGFVGKRFFPATLVTEDPFVADELSFPTASYRKVPAEDDGGTVRQTDVAVDLSKRITENFGLGFGALYREQRPQGGETQRGFDNVAVSAKYVFYKNAEREAILSTGIDWDIGGSGSKRIGAESFSTFTPALFFGKGFGDLSDEMKMLRPFAVTGQIGIGIPSRSSSTIVNDEGDEEVERHPNTLQWAFAVEYSIPYLNANVQGTGWNDVFNRLIPVVEFSFSTDLNRGSHGTTGTINPGIVWAGRYVQVGIEAVIPVNNRSGSGVGVIAQLHFYLDDLFPTTIGKPLLAMR